MKAADSYGSLLRGVSQQASPDRADGQHGEQVNLLSDPVNGLTRRHGSTWEAESHLSTLLPAQAASYMADTANWQTYDLTAGGKDYAVLHRRAARPVSANPLPLMLVYNKTDRVFMTLVRNVVDAPLDLLESGGVSAIAGVGRYLFMTGNDVAISGTSTDVWNTDTNFERAVVWIRGGAYSRKYTVSVRLQAGSVVTVDYTTPSSSYQTPLDTSGIAASDPEYTKKVNDIVNAHSGAVTNWIGTSTAAIQPAAIAESLRLLLVAAGIDCTLEGSHICFNHNDPVKSLEVDDGGDGTLIRGVADEVEAVDKVSVIHHVGKVVKVRSRNAAEAYYLKAIAKDNLVTTGYTEVTWIEGAGTEHAITGGLFYATAVGSNFYIASTAALLNTLTAGDHPTFSISTAGDADSAPTPFFVGKVVTYLGTFQNRLLVGCGGVLSVSTTNDYLNFFRTTVLTLPASDPFEMQPSGSENDNLRYGVMYDQNLVIFGDQRQYVISGRVALTPTGANMPVMSTYEGVTDAPPVAAGGFIFYTKRGVKFSSVHQIQPGQNENSPESFPASSQVDSYLLGGVTEMLSSTGTPSTLFLRTTGARNSLYTFSYLDKPDGRKMDAWSRWDFNTVLGDVIGFSSVVDGLVTFFLRTDSDGDIYVVADNCPLTTGLSTKPYLDSNRPWASVDAGTGSVTEDSGDEWAAAFDETSNRRFTGTLLPNVGTLQESYPGEPGLTVGALQEAYFIPTNPFMRDGKGKAILSGRLTVTKLIMSFKKSTGFKWLITYRGTVESEREFNGRILGDPENLIGVEPISTGQHNVPVGRETRQYEIKLSARRWYPFTATALEWVGQFFNRVQRF